MYVAVIVATVVSPRSTSTSIGRWVWTCCRRVMPGSVGTNHWSGIGGTSFFIDPAQDLWGIFLAQAPNQREEYRLLFRTLAYAALTG